MKAYIRSLLRDAAGPISARNLVREYLQARILESLQRSGAMICSTDECIGSHESRKYPDLN